MKDEELVPTMWQYPDASGEILRLINQLQNVVQGAFEETTTFALLVACSVIFE